MLAASLFQAARVALDSPPSEPGPPDWRHGPLTSAQWAERQRYACAHQLYAECTRGHCDCWHEDCCPAPDPSHRYDPKKAPE